MLSRRHLLLLPLLSGCGAEPVEAPDEAPDPVATTPSGKPERTFSYVTLDRRLVTHLTYRGRMTVIVFAATYDAGSQVQARFVETVFRRHAPRINAMMVVMEAPQNAPLAQAFADSLGLSFDVVMADAATIAGEGPFPGLHHVPSVVLLDRRGREVWRYLGVVEARALDDAISDRDDQSR